jgi:hypothetical protein
MVVMVMKFEEILPEFRAGKKIRCKSWEQGFYIDIDLVFADEYPDLFNAMVTPYDLLNNEWELFPDHIRTFRSPKRRRKT